MLDYNPKDWLAFIVKLHKSGALSENVRKSVEEIIEI